MSYVVDAGQGFVDTLTGQAAADAAIQSGQTIQQGTQQGIRAVQAGTQQGLGFLDPYSGVGLQGVDQAGFLTDPQAQFDFLQNNPLFAASLENANTQTQNLAASRGRLSAGDTLQQLSENVLLSASPLISQQKQSITDLLGFGGNIAGQQAGVTTAQGENIANLISGGSQAQAAGTVGAANAQAQGLAGTIGLGASLAPFLSDKRLKSNIKKVDEINGHNIYTWTWNKIAESLGLSGDSQGVLANEVLLTHPEAVVAKDGFLRVNYAMIGVPSAY